MKKFFLLGALLSTALLFGTAQSAQATFRVILVSGASNSTIDDGDFADTSSDPAVIQYDNTFAGYKVSVTARTNSPGAVIPGSGLTGRVTDTTVTIVNVGGGASPLQVTVYSDGFLLGTGQGRLTNAVSGTALDPNSPTNSTATSNSWINGAATFGTGATTPNGTATGSVTMFGASPVGVGSTNSNIVSMTSPLSITNQLTISNLAVGGGATVTGTAQLSALPAPAGLVLALTALPGIGLGAWIRRRKATVAA